MDDKYVDPYLPYFVHSHLKLKERWPDLWQFVDATTSNTAEGNFTLHLPPINNW